MNSFESTVATLFEEHYFAILEKINQTSFSDNAGFELLPALYIVGDVAAVCSKKDRHVLAESIINRASVVYFGFDKQAFDDRCDLYGSIIRGRPLRCEWFLLNSAPFNKDPVTKCAALLGDILYHPECADDYASTPMLLADPIRSVDFCENVMTPLMAGLKAFFKELSEM